MGEFLFFFAETILPFNDCFFFVDVAIMGSYDFVITLLFFNVV